MKVNTRRCVRLKKSDGSRRPMIESMSWVVGDLESKSVHRLTSSDYFREQSIRGRSPPGAGASWGAAAGAVPEPRFDARARV